MDYKQKFNQWKSRIEALETDQLQLPNMPVDAMCGEAETLQAETRPIKINRDKAYTLLYNKVSAIRKCGRYMFWRNDERKEKNDSAFFLSFFLS